MDPLPWVAVGVAIVILVGAGVLASRRSASEREARDAARIADDLQRWKTSISAVDAVTLGEAITFDLGTVARGSVERALSDARGVTALAPDRWLLEWARDDDLGVAWSDGPGGGGMVSLWFARETLGVLVGVPNWQRLLRVIEQQAAVDGVLPHRVTGLLLPTSVEIDGDRLWIRDPSA